MKREINKKYKSTNAEGFKMDFHSLENSLLKELEKIILEKEKEGIEVSEEKIESMIEKMYSREMIDEYSEPVYNTLINQAPIMYEEHRLEELEFESRLQMRWLNAFYGLKSVIIISEEISMGIIDEYLEDKKRDDGTYLVPFEYDMIFKLHGKSIVVSKEIFTLLKSGYSDAAISRWRTLHEISVVLALVTDCIENNTDNAQELASRFYNRSIVEEYKIKKNSTKMSKEERNILEGLKKDFFDIKKKYGTKFIQEEYEWARIVFPEVKGKIYFSHLEKKTKSTELTSYYKMANSQIHSTSFGLHQSFGDMDGSRIGVVYGPSNYGLSIPGQLTIISIIRSTTSLLLVDSTLDKVVNISILQRFFENYSTIFDDIQVEIEKEEEMRKREIKLGEKSWDE